MTTYKSQKKFNKNLLEFLKTSTTPFHAVENMKNILQATGYFQLDEADSWNLEIGGKYFVIRNGASIIAFEFNKNLLKNGLHMVGAHTDSPNLKVKPNPEIMKNGYFQTGVEIYGGALLNPWFDRDLSLAGRVSFEDDKGNIQSLLLDFKRPIAIIPSLAIHLDRDANINKTIDKQKHLSPILFLNKGNADIEFISLLANEIENQHSDIAIANILDFELSFYDFQAPSLLGLNEEFVVSARLDNLLSCYAGISALVDSKSVRGKLLVCNDHEEVGSISSSGAQGPFLHSVMQRIMPNNLEMLQCIHNSMLISADNAHAIHPNFSEKHDENHVPLINNGPVIKINANQRYATNSETSAYFKKLCSDVDVQTQSFVVRSDMACGSTIGPIVAAELGVSTIDVGVPTFAMHSIRETAGSDDTYSLYRVLKQYYSLS